MAKRRLKMDHKGTLFAFATERLIDKAARRAEDLAGRDFAESLVEDFQKIATKPVLAAMAELNILNTTTQVSLPDSIPVLSVGKEFERPDGVNVKRDDRYVLLDAPLSRTMNTTSSECLLAFVRGADRPTYNNGWRRAGHMRGLVNDVPLLAPLKVPMGFALSFDGLKADQPYDPTPMMNHRKAPWISSETLSYLQTFYEAGRSRATAENELWRIMGKIILQATAFEEVLDYWPEAIELEDRLFPPKPGNQLIALSAEDKAKLCSNLAGRGVEAPACAA